MVEEFEVGAELDRALRAAVTGLAQLMERRARRSTDRSRAATAQARDEWLLQRDGARRGFGPWRRRGAIEAAPARAGAAAWASAAAWSAMDPLAQEAEADLAQRFLATHGHHPSMDVHPGLPVAAPAGSSDAPLTVTDALDLATDHAPYYYAHRLEPFMSDEVALELIESGRDNPDYPEVQRPDISEDERAQFLADWEHFARTGDLPERSRWEAWAEFSGQGDRFADDQWLTDAGEVDHETRDAELRQLWDETAEDRAQRDVDDHQRALAAAGLPDLRSTVTAPDQPTWLGLLDADGFAAAAPREIAHGWRDAAAAASMGDLAAQAAAAQLAENIRRRHGVDPQTYLVDAMTDRAATHAEARRDAEDRARRSAEAIPLTGGTGPGQTIVLGQDPTTSRNRVVELNTAAAQHFADGLRPGSTGHSYLVDRLGAEVLQGPWALGYAPPGWTRLTDHLRRHHGATNREILDAGLGRVSSKGNVIDAFRDRAMMGIRDAETGEIVGFVGRDLSGDQRAPKYVNTGTTPAFVKGDQVFGLHEAATGAALVRVEGPFDAMAITLASDGQAAGVAPLGTAMSRTQAALLADRATEGRVWLALDGDEAGQAATEKDLMLLSERGVDVRAIEVTGSDPADTWRESPGVLRSTVATLDQAEPAGMIVIHHDRARHRDALEAGEEAAHLQHQALAERVAGATPDPVEAELIRRTAGATPADGKAVPRQRYDRAGESDLAGLPEAAREARLVSGHGFTAPTGEMVRGTVASGPEPAPAARPTRSGPRPGRSPHRSR